MPREHIRSAPSTKRVAAVGAVDLGLIVAVLAWGLQTHAANPVAMPGHALRTIVPFLLGWAVWAPVAGSYRARALAGWRRGVSLVLVTWFAAALTGAGIRATSLVPGSAPWIFVAVVFGVGAGALVPWRALVCLSARA